MRGGGDGYLSAASAIAAHVTGVHQSWRWRGDGELVVEAAAAMVVLVVVMVVWARLVWMTAQLKNGGVRCRALVRAMTTHLHHQPSRRHVARLDAQHTHHEGCVRGMRTLAIAKPRCRTSIHRSSVVREVVRSRPKYCSIDCLHLLLTLPTDKANTNMYRYMYVRQGPLRNPWPMTSLGERAPDRSNYKTMGTDCEIYH